MRASLAAALLLAAPAGAVVGPWQENAHSKVRLVTPYAAAERQGPFHFAVEFELAPGWHAYWRNSGDAGFPPVFDAAATSELRGVRTLFPAPRRFALPGGLESFGYAERVTYPLEATIAAAETAPALPLRVRADYLVCEVECVPYRYDLALDQPLAAAARADPATAAGITAWRERVPRPVAAAEGAETWAAAAPAGDGWLLTVHLREPRPGADMDAFFDVHPVFAIERAGGLRFRLAPKDASAAAPAASEFSWVVGAFDARQTLELRRAGPGPGPARGLGWPALAAALVLAIALAFILLARKVP